MVFWLFRISKIQFFESNSQRGNTWFNMVWSCSEYQRYNFLKAIHNRFLPKGRCPFVVQNIKDTIFWKQFTTCWWMAWWIDCCSEYQRYNFLKAIHNFKTRCSTYFNVVQNIKDTIFWKQFTTKNKKLWT